MERYVCGDCGHIYYSNPKIVVGSVVVHEGRILLCRRAIEPRKGFWTLPAGFLEEHETPEDGARREAKEEAECDIVLDALLAVYSVAADFAGATDVSGTAGCARFRRGPRKPRSAAVRVGRYSVDGVGVPQRALGAGPLLVDEGPSRLRAGQQSRVIAKLSPFDRLRVRE